MAFKLETTQQINPEEKQIERNIFSPSHEYKITLDVFEGPLDVLLHLIRKEKISIYDVSLTKITDQYLAFLETMRELDLDIAGDFLVMAATLIYLKSRTLLEPKLPQEEEDLEEEKKQFVDRLLEYEKFKKISAQLEFFEKERNSLFFRPQGLSIFAQQPSQLEAEIFDLVLALQGVLHKAREEEIFIPIEINEIDIKDKIRQILTLLRKNTQCLFEELLEGKYGRHHLVATFLAILELVKAGKIKVQQTILFGEVIISLNPSG